MAEDTGDAVVSVFALLSENKQSDECQRTANKPTKDEKWKVRKKNCERKKKGRAARIMVEYCAPAGYAMHQVMFAMAKSVPLGWMECMGSNEHPAFKEDLNAGFAGAGRVVRGFWWG